MVRNMGVARDLGYLRVPGNTLIELRDIAWSAEPLEAPTDVMVQCSAHGEARLASCDAGTITWERPQRRVAPGQSVVLYDSSDRWVLGGGIAARESVSRR